MDSIDQLKSTSSSEDQINTMITMMMQLPEFSSANNRDNPINRFSPPEEFYGGATNPSHIPFSSSYTQLPSTTISFSNNTIPNLQQQQQQQQQSANTNPYEKKNSMAAMREMMFRIAAMQPINIDPESVKPPKRRNVKISKDPQSVAARHRRERISERIRILQRLVPGGTKMDTASMLDEAIHYVKFLKTQVQSFQRAAANNNNNNRTVSGSSEIGFPVPLSSSSVTNHTPYFSLSKPYQGRNVERYGDV